MLQTDGEIQITRSAPGARRFASLVQFAKLRFRQMSSCSGDVPFKMAHLPRNRRHYRASPENPRQRDLTLTGLSLCRDPIKQRAGLYEVARGEWIPRYEADAFPFTISKHVLAVAVDQIVAVLHGKYIEELRSRFDVGHGYFAQAGVTHQAFFDEENNGAELLLSQYLRIDAMKLP
jgi:hypothetical protein